MRSRARQDEAAVGAERPGELEVKLEVVPLGRSVLQLEVEALVHADRLTDEEGSASVRVEWFYERGRRYVSGVTQLRTQICEEVVESEAPLTDDTHFLSGLERRSEKRSGRVGCCDVYLYFGNKNKNKITVFTSWIMRSAMLMSSKSALDNCPRQPHASLPGFWFCIVILYPLGSLLVFFSSFFCISLRMMLTISQSVDLSRDVRCSTEPLSLLRHP